MKRLLIAVVATLMGLASDAADGQEAKEPSPVLQVVRLKAGETRRVELALPFGGVEFRTGGRTGRDFLYLETLPKATGGAQTAKGTSIKHDDKYVFEVGPGVKVGWVEDRPEIEFRAEEGAKAGTRDVKLRYESFGGGTFVGGFRVIVEEK
jgi:hypothetical protein